MKKPAILAVAIVLAGCSSPPSDADAREAMMRMTAGVAGASGVESMKSLFKDIKVSGCAKADPQGYQCDVTGMMGSARSIRFIKTKEGWTVIQ